MMLKVKWCVNCRNTKSLGSSEGKFSSLEIISSDSDSGDGQETPGVVTMMMIMSRWADPTPAWHVTDIVTERQWECSSDLSIIISAGIEGKCFSSAQLAEPGLATRPRTSSVRSRWRLAPSDSAWSATIISEVRTGQLHDNNPQMLFKKAFLNSN